MCLKNKYPIYVISKGRSTCCLTARELKKMGVEFTLVVEPQEYEAYKKINDKILVTPFSNLGQGSIPVRNFVWEHSVSIGAERHWILDDNIEAFYRLNHNEKNRVLSPVFFRVMEDFVDRYINIAIAGSNYYAFADTSSSLPPYRLNTRIYSCILIKNDLPYRWRGKYNEDTDLCLRALKDGWCTVLFNAFLIGKKTTMRMKGGNTDEIYADTDNRREFAESLQKQHPDVVKVVWKFGRWHHQVNYEMFDQKLVRDYNVVVQDGINEYGMLLIGPSPD